MGKKKKIKSAIGDIFSIPIDDKSYGYGQIVDLNWYAIFDITGTEQHPPLAEITAAPIIFLAASVDVRIEDGEWKIIGHSSIPKNIHFPEFVIGTLGGQPMVTDHLGKIVRPVSQDEIRYLTGIKSYSPSVIEDAVKAKFGFAEWFPYLDNLTYKQ
jgi:hypothetical protein